MRVGKSLLGSFNVLVEDVKILGIRNRWLAAREMSCERLEPTMVVVPETRKKIIF